MTKQAVIDAVLESMKNWPTETSGNGFSATHFLITTDFRGSKYTPVMLVADEIVWKESSSYFLKRKLEDSDILKELYI